MLKVIPAQKTAAIVSQLALDGACIVHNLLSPHTCDTLLAEFKPHLDQIEWGIDELGYRNDFYGSQTKRLHGLFSRSHHMMKVLCHPVINQVASSLFVTNRRANDIRLSNCELMVLSEHQTAQAFHNDAASWQQVQKAVDDEILVSVNYALTDFTEINGATRVVPGSHTWQPGREPVESEICQAIMPKGAGLIYSGNVIHSGGANTSGEVRSGLYLGYIPSWLRPLENQLVTNNPDDIHQLPSDAKLLLDVAPGGFTVFA